MMIKQPCQKGGFHWADPAHLPTYILQGYVAPYYVTDVYEARDNAEDWTPATSDIRDADEPLDGYSATTADEALQLARNSYPKARF